MAVMFILIHIFTIIVQKKKEKKKKKKKISADLTFITIFSWIPRSTPSDNDSKFQFHSLMLMWKKQQQSNKQKIDSV